MLGGVFGVPAVDSDGIAGFLVIAGKDGRKLLDGHVRGKFLPAVIEPRLRIESVIITRAHRIVPVPGAQRMIRGMSGSENFRDAIRIAFGFLKHRKLIGPHGLVFVDPRLPVPAGEGPTVSTPATAVAKASHRRA